jgi:hypothetical protein
MRKFKPPEDLSEIGKESKICTLSNAPQQTINNVSQDMIGSECTKSSSPHRNGESSFRIMKNEYDCTLALELSLSLHVTISPVSMIRHSFSLGDKFRQTL